MKKIIFVLLKIAEISLIPASIYFMEWIGSFFMYDDPFWITFLAGFATVLSVIGIGAILYAIYLSLPDFFEWWISSNKEWSENISKWLKSRFS